jgi:23S rRNA (adenine2030-N6)-methyltransferase
LDRYPGSPAIALSLSRPQDRLTFYELQDVERARLKTCIGGDRRAGVIADDGWVALKAALPPPERRGLVLIDPPFEAPGEFQRLVQGLEQAHRRWATGIYLVWYPVKDPPEVAAFARRIVKLEIPKILRVELAVAAVTATGSLAACGMLVVNPPWVLERELQEVMPDLARVLGRDGNARVHVDWLAP